MRLVTPRLLITDDDRDFRETVAGVLSDRGFETLQAADGEEALHIVSRHEIHLLLLDMQMPRLTGLETIERLREQQSVGWVKAAAAADPREGESVGRDQLAGTDAQRWSSSAGPPSGDVGPAQAALVGATLYIPMPWILISGALDEQIIARARASCAFSVLPKPLRLPELTGAATQALAHAYNWRAA